MGFEEENRKKTDWEYCEQILPRVSRTFALNIKQLEGDTYRAVLLGYLLFRVADTFEDNAYQSEAEKIKELRDFAEIFRGEKGLAERLKLYEPLKFKWREQTPEKDLVENGDRVIRCCFELPKIYREIIDRHLIETAEGMARFQERKLKCNSKIFQLQDLKDLEDYCYYVGGNVGVMLTRIFCLRESILSSKSDLEKRQIQFGLALQLTNIIKDYPNDIKRGWCYIPASITGKYEIEPEEIICLSTEQRKGILKELIPRVVEHFNSTLEYISVIPEAEKSVRMFCIIPFVLAYNTLLQIVEMKGDKLSRAQVAALLTECEAYAKSNSLLEGNYSKIRHRLSSLS